MEVGNRMGIEATRCWPSGFEHVPGFYLILLDTRLSKIQEHFCQVKSSRSLFWIPLGLVWILLGAP